MKRHTTISVGLLVAVVALILTTVTAQSSEEPESSLSKIPPSSQSPGETEVSPEQKFIELSRRKKPSNLRRRPPSRRFRTSTSPPEVQTQPTSQPIPQTTQLSTEIPPVTSTAATSPPAVSTDTPSPTPITNKKVQFTGIRATKSERGQVFSFTFKKPGDISAEEKEPRIPDRFSPVFTSQTPKQHGGIPLDLSETNQPTNPDIDSSPPGDVPRARPLERALNLPVSAGQSFRSLEENTPPAGNDESTSSRSDKIPPRVKPKSKTRPYDGRVNSLTDVPPTPDLANQQFRESQPVNTKQNSPSSSVPERPKEPLKLVRVLPSNSDNLGEVSIQTQRGFEDSGFQALNVNQGQKQSKSPRIRFVKAGSLRFIPRQPKTSESLLSELTPNSVDPTVQSPSLDDNLPQTQIPNSQYRNLNSNLQLDQTINSVDPTVQTNSGNEGRRLAEDENLPVTWRPNSEYRPLRPGSLRLFPIVVPDSPSLPREEPRNDVALPPQTLSLKDGRDPSQREFPQETPTSNQLRQQESQTFQPSRIPDPFQPELAREFLDPDLQSRLANRDPARLGLAAQQRLNRPINTESLGFLPNNANISPELPQQTIRDMASPAEQIVNERQELSQERLLELFQLQRRLKNAFLPTESQRLPPRPVGDFADPTLKTSREKERQDLAQLGPARPSRPFHSGTPRLLQDDPQPQLAFEEGNGPVRQEALQTNRPSGDGSPRFLFDDLRRPSAQSTRTFVDPNLQTLTENEEQGPTPQEPARANRPVNSGGSRLLSNLPQALPPQLEYDEVRGLVNQESPRTNRPSGDGSQRFFLNDPRRPSIQLTRDFNDPNLQALIENEEQALARQVQALAKRPSILGASRLLPNNPQGIDPRLIDDFAAPKLQSFTENKPLGSTGFSSPVSLGPDIPSQSGPVRLPTNQASREQDLNLSNIPLNERRVVPIHQNRLSSLTPDSLTQLQRINLEPEIDSPPSSAERPLAEVPISRDPSVRLQSNKQIVTPNTDPESPQTNAPLPIEPKSPSTTDDSGVRVQNNPQNTIQTPGFSSNPTSNIPRLIIEFPTSSANGDQSIRLQLNPNASPSNSRPTNNPQANIPKIPSEEVAHPTTTDTSNQPKQQSTSGETVINPQSVSQLPAQLVGTPATVTNDSPTRIQTSQLSSLITQQASNSQITAQQLSEILAAIGNSSGLLFNQQIPINKGGAVNSRSNNPQFSAQNISPPKEASSLRDQLKHLPLSLSGTVPTVLQTNSQALSQNSQIAVNPLPKALASPVSPLKSTTSSRLETKPLDTSSNAGRNLNSQLNSVEQTARVADDSSISLLGKLNSPIITNEGRTATPSLSLLSPSKSEATLSDSQTLAAKTEQTLNSSDSQGLISESKPPVTNGSSKSNPQVQPVDVRLTINFNSNIPGFPGQPQQQLNSQQTAGINTRLSNNTQLNSPSSAQEQSAFLPPSTSELLTRPQATQHFQSAPATPSNTLTAPLTTPSQLPVDLLNLVSSSTIRPQSNLRSPVNLGPSFNAQFNGQVFPITSSQSLQSSIRSQLLSELLNANAGQVNSQFNTLTRQFNTQSTPSPITQDQLVRSNQNTQFFPANTGFLGNSQFNIPGRYFEVQSQQSPTTGFLARIQPNSQFLTNSESVNPTLNNFGALSTPSSLLTARQDTSTRLQPVPQTTGVSAGLDVNSPADSPGLPVELLPPVTSEGSNGLRTNVVPITNEQARVSFLVNSPSLSAELLPPEVSESTFVQPLEPSPQQNPFLRSSALSFQTSPQLSSGPRIPEPSIELLPPIDPFFPQYSRNPNIGFPPTPIFIPKPAVPALVPPPRQRIALPIDIPKPAVPALVPPPREQIAIPIDIPKPAVPALVPPPREQIAIPIDIPRPAVPALVPPPREQIAIPIDIPKPAVSALVPPRREQIDIPIDIPKPDVPALVPPPRPSDLALSGRLLPPPPTFFAFNPSNVSVFQQENVQANPQPVIQTSSDNPVLILPKSSSRQQFVQGRLNLLSIEDLSRRVGFVPENAPVPFSSPIQTSKQTDSILQVTDIRTGRVQPIGQSLPIPSPTQMLIPPVGEDPNSASAPTTSPQTLVQSSPNLQSNLPQSSPEGFIIFQTPTITVTSQTNQADSQINVAVVTQGGTGHIKPNTTLTAEPVRPVNQTSITDHQSFVSTTPTITSTSRPLQNLQSPSPELSQPNKNILPLLGTGSSGTNFTSNPFAPPFSQSLSSFSNPFRFPNPTFSATETSTACPKLDLQHKGHKAPQITGNLILAPGFYPIDNPTPTRCDNRARTDGKKINWWQVLLTHGGEPSTLIRSNESKDAKIPPLTNPCVRPFETDGVPVFYNATKTDSQTYYREELAYHRFPESKNHFLESRGLFVWTQSKSSFDSTTYLVLYTRDDSGFWLQVQNVDCKFNRNSQPNLQCRSVPECYCEGGVKRCTESVPVLTRNFPLKSFIF